MALTRINNLGITDGTIVNADINASAAIATSKLGTGAVLQVVTATTSTSFSTTSSSFTAVTNLSVSITPSSASNKILILVSSTIHVNSNSQTGKATIFRGATDLGNTTNGFSAILAYLSTTTIATPLHISFLDSPSTTSSTTYQVYVKTTGATIFVPWDDEKSSITALEIKG